MSEALPRAVSDSPPSTRLPPMGLLLVEDHPADARLLLETLREVTGEGELVVRTVRTLAEALTEIRRFSFTCVLVDLGLPDGRGVGNVEALRAIDRSVAIVVLTGIDDEHLAAEAIRMGAQEYVVKGYFDGPKLLRLLRHAIERNKHVHELEDRRRREFYRASHDGLTGLANRELLQDRVRQLMSQARRTGESFALCYLDLDGFKAVNDSHGHRVGDAVLIRVGEILAESVRPNDTIARIGGDEFVALVAPVASKAEIESLAQRLRERIIAVRQVADSPVMLGASIGIVLFPDHGESIEALLENADRAMYEVKRGGGGVAFFDALPNKAQQTSATLRIELADALQSDRLSVLYQPWVDTASGCFAGMEVLVRWEVDGRLLRPKDFLRDGATDSTASLEVGLHAALRACRQWRQWCERGVAPPVFALTATDRDFLDERYLPGLIGIAGAAGVHPHEIRLEVSTSALAGEHSLRLTGQLRRARDLGLGLVLDQFGLDGEALKWLTVTPFDGVKLSRQVMRGLSEEGPGGAMRRFLSAVLGAAAALGLPVIATGVETHDDRVLLQMMGCPLMQGALFGQAENPDEMTARLGRGPAGLEQER